MDKELEKQLLEKIIKYIEKNPLEQWSEKNYWGMRSIFLSPDKKIGIISVNYLWIKLNPENEDYSKRQSFYSFNLPLATTIRELFEKEKERRKELLLLEYQKKEKEALDEFLNSPI